MKLYYLFKVINLFKSYYKYFFYAKILRGYKI